MTVAGKECGTCTLCCKTMVITEIEKPPGVWCTHHKPGKRCTIYETRYDGCRAFYCQWMREAGLGPEWKPDRARFVLAKTDGGRRLTACVDPGSPSAWRRSPYYENLKHWSAMGLKRSDPHVVEVTIGDRHIVILPDRDVDVGILAADEAITVEGKASPGGMAFEVRKAKIAAPLP